MLNIDYISIYDLMQVWEKNQILEKISQSKIWLKFFFVNSEPGQEHLYNCIIKNV